MIHRVTKATARTDYTVEVVFETGDRAMIDFSAFVADGEVTEPLRADPTYFASTLRILPRGDGIGWPGDVDIDADALWYKAHPEDWERDYGEAGRAANA